MYKEKKFLAVIPARSGSKGIPNKNIVLVNGKPLLQYTIDEALKSKYLDDIIVSTDSIDIANIAKKLGAQVPFLRPAHLATDHSKSIETILHVIETQKNNGYSYDYVVLLQPTQPLRKYWHIDQAIDKIVNSNQASLVSISELKENPILIRKLKANDLVENLLPLNSTVRRQDLPTYYKVNGSIYINKINVFLTKNTSLNDNIVGFIMDKKFDLDIDEPSDLSFLKFLLS